ncbi:MAG: NAD(P)H-binding protein [Planctomycetota bacterium]
MANQNGDTSGADRGSVAVTGATGFVGRAVVDELLERGWRVRALARGRERANQWIGDDRIEVVYGDVRDPKTTGDLVAGASAAIHLVGILREGRDQKFEELHVDATRNVVRACRDRKVRRYVHMSALGVDDEGRCEYQRTKFEAETIVRGSDLDWTILRPSLIHGPGGEFAELIAGWSRGEIPPFIGLPYFRRPEADLRVPLGGTDYVDPCVQPVFVGDVAAYFAEALERPETIGEVFNVVGPERMSWPEMLQFAHGHVPHAKKGLKPMWVPAEIAAAKAQVASFVGLGRLLPFDAGMATMGGQDSTAEIDRGRGYFDAEPKSFRESFPEYAGTL